MAPEVDRNSLSPFDKVALIYSVARKDGPDPHTRDYRLEDGMVVHIYKHERLAAYSILMNPLEPELPRFSFHISEGEKGSHAVIDFPNIVFKVDDITFAEKKVESVTPNDEDSSIIAEKLVNWLDQTMKANKYIRCPISVGFKTSR